METFLNNQRLLHTDVEHYDHVDLDADEVFFAKALKQHFCPCCNVQMFCFEHELSTSVTKRGFAQEKWLKIEICPDCGWWHFQRDMEFVSELGERSRATWWELTHAVQTKIDLGSITLTTDQLQRHLLRRWDDRNLISAQQAEDLVSSLLKEHHGGEVIRLTANANAADGGIDLYILSPGDGSIQRAVQVKRRIYKDVESVREVRDFIGAMVLSRFDEGIFVTTASRFSKTARAIPQKAGHAKCKLHLDLIDGQRLFEMLRETNLRCELKLPPLVTLEQEWRDVSGRSILAQDLFFGDLKRVFGS